MILLRFDAGINRPLEFDFPHRVERSKKRKFVLILVQYGEVLVRAPRHMSMRQLRAVVATRLDWIHLKLKEQAGQKPPKPKRFEAGESFPYLGRRYRLQLIEEDAASARVRRRDARVRDKADVMLKNGRIQIYVDSAWLVEKRRTETKKRLLAWYREHALRKLTARTHHYAAEMGVTVNEVRVRTYKARWGTCFTKNRLTFNWRLIMVPPRVLDYVVVHELCHIFEYNHSPKYWSHVADVMPDYKDSGTWLKKYGENLEF